MGPALHGSPFEYQVFVYDRVQICGVHLIYTSQATLSRLDQCPGASLHVIWDSNMVTPPVLFHETTNVKLVPYCDENSN